MPARDDQQRARMSSNASEPSTPTSTASKTPTKKSEPSFYESYMANPDAYHRRLRKSPNAASGDAAGLLSSSKHMANSSQLRSTTLDQDVESFTPSKHFIPGRSFVSVTDLLKHHEEPTSSQMRMSGRLNGDASLRHSIGDFRPCMRPCDRSFQSSFLGSGMTIPEENARQKPIRKVGGNAPSSDTSTRVFLAGGSLAEAADSTPTKWSQHFDVAQSVTRDMELIRASTAPAKQMTEARKYYHADFIGNNDVFQYRHSGGICPDEYKFVSSDRPRKSASAQKQEKEVKQRPGSARESYTDATRSYSYNRVRSYMSNITY